MNSTATPKKLRHPNKCELTIYKYPYVKFSYRIINETNDTNSFSFCHRTYDKVEPLSYELSASHMINSDRIPKKKLQIDKQKSIYPKDRRNHRWITRTVCYLYLQW